MLLTLNWLDEFVDCKDLSPQEIANRLTMSGLEVERVHFLGEGLENVIIGEIVGVKEHPKETRWKICQVYIGKERIQVVSGAPYLETGKRVVVALPGVQLPNGEKVERVSLKGVDSYANLVSEIELGLCEEGEVETVLFPETGNPGTPATALIHMDDHLLETSPTPNRPDCMGILGIARELSVLLDRPLKPPQASFPEGPSLIEDTIEIEIQDPDLCHRYCARFVEGIEVGPSPLYMKVRLKAAGMRPISNVVDVTNYVLVELGHPLHAFDYDSLRGHKVVVRRAKAGETLVTLDGNARDLEEEMLLIADAERGIALAGIMGGANSEVRSRSQKVLLESAFFEPTSIRKTAKRLGLSTEASKRFERGTDIKGLKLALERTTQLILEVAGGRAARGVKDVYPTPYTPKEISLSHSNLSSILGAEIPPKKVITILNGLGFSPKEKNGSVDVTVPPHRAFDVSREIDLVEEVARIHGYHNLPSTMPSGPLPRNIVENQATLVKEVQDLLAGMGLMEVINYSLTDPKRLRHLDLSSEDPRSTPVRLLNPLSEDMSVMRTSLLPGLLATAEGNEKVQIKDLAVFEVGRVFIQTSEEHIEERLHLGILAMGTKDTSWDEKGKPYDFFYIKSVLEQVIDKLTGEEIALEEAPEPFLHPGRAARAMLGSTEIGYLGEIHPHLTRSHRISHRCYAAEISLEALSKEKEIVFTPLPKFPGIIRDLSVIAPQSIPHKKISTALQDLRTRNLKEIRLIDLYAGPPIDPGHKSLTYSLLYRAQDRTLTDEEIEQEHNHLLEELEKRLPVKIRR